MSQCPLCQQDSLQDYFRDKNRDFQQCQLCQLVSVASRFHLSTQAEKAEYDKHQNDPNEPDYCRFLGRAFNPLVKRLASGNVGLDFGCGPGPAISQMAKAHQLEVKNYDPYYFNQPNLLEKQYHFITMTEVIEHIAEPATLLTQLDRMLKPAAILAIMTKRVLNQQAFASWHYKNDPTHICFYSQPTFQWIAKKMGWRLEIIDQDVVFFHKE